MKRIYYKAVTNHLQSCAGIDTVQYIKNEYVEAHIKGSGLLVFKTLALARKFVYPRFKYPDSYIRIYRCHCEGKMKLPIYRINTLARINPGDIDRLWNMGIGGFFHVMSWPEGTLAFKRVKLLSEVK